MRLTAARLDRLIEFIRTQRPPCCMTQADRDLVDAFQWRVIRRSVGRFAVDGSVEPAAAAAPAAPATELALQVLMTADDSRGAARWMEVVPLERVDEVLASVLLETSERYGNARSAYSAVQNCGYLGISQAAVSEFMAGQRLGTGTG
jgi:hypothetical protein